MGTSLSLVIPAFDEAGRLGGGLQQLMEEVSPDNTEILVVDDGSSDDTAEVARAHLASWPRHEVVSLPHNRGKGAAVRAGVVRARGDVIAYVDADMATDPRDLVSLLAALDGNHLAFGSRAHTGSVVHREVHRRVMNRTFGMLVASMTQLPYMDTQCGFKAFKGSVAKLLFHGSRVDRFAFDVEVLDLAARLGLRREEVAVHWTDVAGSHVRPVHDGLQMLGDVARSRLMRRFQPPVQGVFVPKVPIEMAGASIRPFIRSVDLMVEWEGGTAVLFPCLPPTVSHRISRRLLSDLEACDPTELSVEFSALFAPVSALDVHSREFAM
ncbi:MAG: dolichyl-phosphate beta-glucosyltransferase [Acidimicrobiales bacterium]